MQAARAERQEGGHNADTERIAEHGGRSKGRGACPIGERLMESGAPIVVKEVLSEQTGDFRISEWSGSLTGAGNRATVFPLHPCGDYIYDSAMTHIENIGADFFDNENWYIRLLLEGEDRLAKNQDVRIGKKTISYSCIAEDWDAWQWRIHFLRG